MYHKNESQELALKQKVKNITKIARAPHVTLALVTAPSSWVSVLALQTFKGPQKAHTPLTHIISIIKSWHFKPFYTSHGLQTKAQGFLELFFSRLRFGVEERLEGLVRTSKISRGVQSNN